MLPFLALATVLCAAAASKLPLGGHVSNTRQAAALTSSFKWTSTGPLIGPKSDSRKLAGIKDPASTAQASGYNLAYLNFTDFNKADAAAFYYLDQSPIGTGYRAAPQVFYFAPQKLWYLVYQTGNAAYSTNKDIANPTGWTAPKTFYPSQPSIITQNIGSGYWVDMWAICDAANCHLFSSDDNGHLYRSQTALANFPSGFTSASTVIALSDKNKDNVFEASCVYALPGDKPSYLLLVEAIGSDGTRYFRSWTATSIAGPWTGLADSEASLFAGASNVAFSGTPWTKSISHGEMVRSLTDQTITIDPCHLRFLYQGMDPSASGTYNSLPWRLGLITQTNSAC
ncbi:glycosyl hydrolase family 62-domain-containing protein [Lasiosphaeria miniovina]|uniref:Alpha-L-arabinofuranosidase n=1 Tax=Lasiosphaeria miniovina TaxID=1954250 RepID=A0AA40A5Z6_9PEZI|nr:glycosyl hydrolase family 62-domain-containing protein [Lasiosphaeria miniovina]KAK0709922.1 glycosyl hydrolase family 62-domain-containing protein [Lasiosphaeria miniovina]